MNPLMQSISGGFPGGSQSNLAQIKNIVGMLRSGNPEQIAQNLMQSNPQFKSFLEANKGKTPEQVAREHGMDLGQIMKKM